MPAKFWNSEKLLSISAILISLATLFTVIYQANLMRKRQYASVLPYLELWQSRINGETFGLSLVNNGLGPAFVKRVQVIYQDKAYPGDLHDFLYSDIVLKEDSIKKLFYSNLLPGRLIPPGGTVELLKVEGSARDFQILKKWISSRNVQLEVIYSSVYEEFWSLKGIGDAPTSCRSVAKCGTPLPP
ncbi:MAG: hypothetical protein AAGA10_05845 [Bacteroidota bacterium]